MSFYTLKDLGIWDLIYEHCSYFSPSSLKTAFEECGFRVLHQAESFQGQFLTIETLLDENPAATGISDRLLADLSTFVSEFKHNFEDKVAKWRSWMRETHFKKQKVVVWGAGSKGATFLNLTDSQKAVEYVVDINPRKHGNYIAGSGQKIVAPEFLSGYKPSTVIVMNPVYLTEIQKMVHALEIQPQFILV